MNQTTNPTLYRYLFDSTVPMPELENTIVLAIIATESLHGETQARIDISHAFDAERRACVIDATTAVGRDFNRLFVGFVTREFGADCFKVERVANASQPTA